MFNVSLPTLPDRWCYVDAGYGGGADANSNSQDQSFGGGESYNSGYSGNGEASTSAARAANAARAASNQAAAQQVAARKQAAARAEQARLAEIAAKEKQARIDGEILRLERLEDDRRPSRRLPTVLSPLGMKDKAPTALKPDVEKLQPVINKAPTINPITTIADNIGPKIFGDQKEKLDTKETKEQIDKEYGLLNVVPSALESVVSFFTGGIVTPELDGVNLIGGDRPRGLYAGIPDMFGLSPQVGITEDGPTFDGGLIKDAYDWAQNPTAPDFSVVENTYDDAMSWARNPTGPDLSGVTNFFDGSMSNIKDLENYEIIDGLKPTNGKTAFGDDGKIIEKPKAVVSEFFNIPKSDELSRGDVRADVPPNSSGLLSNYQRIQNQSDRLSPTERFSTEYYG